MNDSLLYSVQVISDSHSNYDVPVVGDGLVLNGSKPVACLDVVRDLSFSTIYENADLFVFDEQYSRDGPDWVRRRLGVEQPFTLKPGVIDYVS